MPPHAERDKLIRRIIIKNLCLLALSQEKILIIFWIADSYIAINTLVHSCLIPNSIIH
jgi:hypothetical protein